jgi:hypothetical protein
VLGWDSIGATIPFESLFLPERRPIEIASFAGFSFLIIDSRGGWQLAGLGDIRRSAIPRAWRDGAAAAQTAKAHKDPDDKGGTE